MSTVRIFGRNTSHFTRCVRIFAHELGVPYRLEPVADLLSQARGDYGGNPALKLPVLECETGTWFGALSICRELARGAKREADIQWPEDLRDSLAANAQELVLQGMSTEVTLIMGAVKDAPTLRPDQSKNRASLENSVTWLDENLEQVRDGLRKNRALSFFEVTLFCFGTHLPFRKVLDTSSFARLERFCREFGERDSARATEYGV